MTAAGTATEPLVALHRRYRFSASHRLHVEQFSAEQNREIFGKCNNPFGHGHNYTLQVTVQGPIQVETGMVMDLGALDGFVQKAIVDRFDFANMNADMAFAQCPPSTENLARVLWEVLAAFVAGHAPVQLKRIRVEETKNNAFDYMGDAVQGHPAAVR